MWAAPYEYQCIILDGALPRVKELWYGCSKYTNSTAYLYISTPYASMLEISPFIARTGPDDPFLPELYQAVSSGNIHTNWGCLVCTKASPDSLASHFRKWITVYDDVEAEIFFRFYDPDVLPHFVDGLQGDERQWFFGPVNAFLCRQKGQDLLTSSTADRPEGYDLQAALKDMPPSAPWFTLEERHRRAMRPVFWPFLVEDVLTPLLPQAHSYLRHLSPTTISAKIDQCLHWLAEMQDVSIPEVEDGVAFCLLSMTSCSHFFRSPEFVACVRRQGMHEALDEWKHYAGAPIPGLEDWHDAEWLQDSPRG